MDTLSDETREQFDRREADFTPEERKKAAADLRVLVAAHSRVDGMLASLDDAGSVIFAEPYDSDGFYLTVQAPEPGEPDDPDEAYGGHTSTTGSPVIGCALRVAPSAEAPVGADLAGTKSVVTKRYSS